MSESICPTCTGAGRILGLPCPACGGKVARVKASLGTQATPIILTSRSLAPATKVREADSRFGRPVNIFRKELARVGNYRHRGNGDELPFPAERLKAWADNTNAMCGVGHFPYVPNRHRFDLKFDDQSAIEAGNNFGRVLSAEFDGKSLYATLELVGDKALDALAANDISLCVPREQKDDEGRDYGEALQHVAIVPNPALSKLKPAEWIRGTDAPFVHIAASAGFDAMDVPVLELASEDAEPNASDSITKRAGSMVALAAGVTIKRPSPIALAAGIQLSFSPDQPRDGNGQWSSSGGGAIARSAGVVGGIRNISRDAPDEPSRFRPWAVGSDGTAYLPRKDILDTTPKPRGTPEAEAIKANIEVRNQRLNKLNIDHRNMIDQTMRSRFNEQVVDPKNAYRANAEERHKLTTENLHDVDRLNAMPHQQSAIARAAGITEDPEPESPHEIARFGRTAAFVSGGKVAVITGAESRTLDLAKTSQPEPLSERAAAKVKEYGKDPAEYRIVRHDGNAHVLHHSIANAIEGERRRSAGMMAVATGTVTIDPKARFGESPAAQPPVEKPSHLKSARAKYPLGRYPNEHDKIIQKIVAGFTPQNRGGHERGHLGSQSTKLSAIALAADIMLSSEEDGIWRTIDGVHVRFGKDGKINAGPPALRGKTVDEAVAHHKSSGDPGKVGQVRSVEEEAGEFAKGGKARLPVGDDGKLDPHLHDAYKRALAKTGHTLGEFKDDGEGHVLATVTKQPKALVGKADASVQATAKRLIMEHGGASHEGMAAASQRATKLSSQHAALAKANPATAVANLKKSAHYDQVAEHIKRGGVAHDPAAQSVRDQLQKASDARAAGREVTKIKGQLEEAKARASSPIAKAAESKPEPSPKAEPAKADGKPADPKAAELARHLKYKADEDAAERERSKGGVRFPMLSAIALAAGIMLDASPLTGGQWKTINGARVYIHDVTGVIMAGAGHLVGKTVAHAESHGAAPAVRLPDYHPIQRDAKGGYVGTVGEDGTVSHVQEHADRLKALKPPPGNTDVHLSKDPNASRQVKHTDIEGRSQTLYSADHSAESADTKFERHRRFAADLPKTRAAMAEHPSEEAAALRLVDKTGLRIGGEGDTGAKVQAYGATTLRPEHVSDDGKTLTFVGKKGVHIVHDVQDEGVAKELADRKSHAKPGQKLYNTNDRKARAHLASVHPDGDYKVKDFRTAFANREAKIAMRGMKAPTDLKSFVAAQSAVAQHVSSRLGNTPAVALKDYIAPEAFSAWRTSVANGEQAELIHAAAAAKGISPEEAAKSWIPKHAADYRKHFTERFTSPARTNVAKPGKLEAARFVALSGAAGNRGDVRHEPLRHRPVECADARLAGHAGRFGRVASLVALAAGLAAPSPIALAAGIQLSYNPDQPRVPAGSSDGGEFGSGGATVKKKMNVPHASTCLNGTQAN